MSDAELINDGYAAAVRGLFGEFFTRLAGAQASDDPKKAIADAEQAFSTGLSIARDARDRAVKLL